MDAVEGNQTAAAARAKELAAAVEGWRAEAARQAEELAAKVGDVGCWCCTWRWDGVEVEGSRVCGSEAGGGAGGGRGNRGVG